jgi:hypothetical protein
MYLWLCVYTGVGAVSWQSKRKPSVALATGDAEYIGLAQAAREIVWLRQILNELGSTKQVATVLYVDNRHSLLQRIQLGILV